MRKLGMALLFSIVIFASAGTALAGTINPEEARVIDAASGVFVYEGVEYKSTESALASLTAYLNQDGVELTVLQADRAIQLMQYEKNIKSAIDGGYIVAVDGSGDGGGNGNGDGDGTDNGDGNGGDPGDGGGNGNGEVPGPDGQVQLLFREAILTALDGDGQTVYQSTLPIKNTGYMVGWPLLVALLLCMAGSLVLLRVPKKHRLWALPLGFIILLIAALNAGGYGAAHAVRDQLYSSLALGAPETAYVDEWQKAIGEDLPRDGALSGADLLPPAPGSLYARMTSDDVQLNAPVYFGDTDEIFGKGAGQYILSGLPGEGEPILLGGHDVSWFASLEDIAPGDEITLTTSYGVFVYQVSQTFVAKADEVTWDGLSATSGERLVLYTCYPIGSLLGVREDRLFVLCDKASGPRIIKTGGSL